LEAFPAKHRASLRGLEGDGGFFTALRAGRLRLRSYLPAYGATAFGPLGFACFAALRFVLKTLVGEKHLFASSKNELGATLGTLQNLIVEFHGRLPWTPIGQEGPAGFSPWAWTQRWNRFPKTPKTDPLGQRAKNLSVFPTSLPDWGLIPEVRRRATPRAGLILFATLLLAQSLPRKRFFSPALLTGLHVEAVLLYLFNDVFLLHLALKTSQCIFKRLILLNDHLCQ
jgi:hypothetical protein